MQCRQKRVVLLISKGLKDTVGILEAIVQLDIGLEQLSGSSQSDSAAWLVTSSHEWATLM